MVLDERLTSSMVEVLPSAAMNATDSPASAAPKLERFLAAAVERSIYGHNGRTARD
jgi:hypothetical protein